MPSQDSLPGSGCPYCRGAAVVALAKDAARRIRWVGADANFRFENGVLRNVQTDAAIN